jgi:hypothetical protein
VIHGTSGVIQSGLKILGLKIGKVREDFRAALAGGVEIQDVANANAHPSDAGPAAALIGVVGDPMLCHGDRLRGFWFVNRRSAPRLLHSPKWRITASAKPLQLTGSTGGSTSRASSGVLGSGATSG